MQKFGILLVGILCFLSCENKPEEKIVRVSSIQLDRTETEIRHGCSFILHATALPEDAEDKTIQWSSSDESVAGVDYITGEVHTREVGTATITASCADGVSAACIVTVLDDLSQEPFFSTGEGAWTPASAGQAAESPDGLRVVWNKGDRIGLVTFAGDNAPEAGVECLDDACEGLSNGHLASALSFEDRHVAFFPVHEAPDYYSYSAEENQVHFTSLPSIQVWKDASPDPRASVSVAKEEHEDGNLCFRNLTGLLRIRLTGDATIVKLLLTSARDEVLWGAASVDMGYGAEGPVLRVTKADFGDPTRITLDCAEGVRLQGEQPLDFYLAVPPGTLADGFTVSVWEAGGSAMYLQGAASEKNRIVRSQITAMPALPFRPGTFAPGDGQPSLRIRHACPSFTLPLLRGSDAGWAVQWGDGASTLYSPGLTHPYDPAEERDLTIQTSGMTGFTVDGLSGITCIDLSNM